MEFRIGINNRRKQFSGISRNHLCNFLDGVQYQFPYPVRDGQLESTSCDLTEDCSDGLVGLKTFHRAKLLDCIMVSVKLAICAEKCTL